MPVQIQRLLIAFAIFIGLMLVLKYYLTPESWREYGPYRGNALKEIAAHNAKFVQMETCIMCHDSIGAEKDQGFHKNLECEICHGVGYQHVDDPEIYKMEVQKDGQICMRCHSKNPARPAGVIKQVDAAEHCENEDCLTCHNPHQP